MRFDLDVVSIEPRVDIHPLAELLTKPEDVLPGAQRGGADGETAKNREAFLPRTPSHARATGQLMLFALGRAPGR